MCFRLSYTDITTVKKKKALVLFYSFEGNTKRAAGILAKNLNAETLELKPVKEIASKGFFSKYFWGGKQIFSREKPTLRAYDKEPENFDLIVIGTPVWAFTYTPAIRSFLATHNLKDKNIALFCTHDGAPGRCLLHMSKKLDGNNIIGKQDFTRIKSMDKAELEKRCLDWANQINKSYPEL